MMKRVSIQSTTGVYNSYRFLNPSPLVGEGRDGGSGENQG